MLICVPFEEHHSPSACEWFEPREAFEVVCLCCFGRFCCPKRIRTYLQYFCVPGTGALRWTANLTSVAHSCSLHKEPRGYCERIKLAPFGIRYTQGVLAFEDIHSLSMLRCRRQYFLHFQGRISILGLKMDLLPVVLYILLKGGCRV